MKQEIPFINTGKTCLDAGLQEIAWFNALKQAQTKGFSHVVSVTALPNNNIQLHYFKTLEGANEFYNMTKEYKDFWKGSFSPCTIKQALKQCWS